MRVLGIIAFWSLAAAGVVAIVIARALGVVPPEPKPPQPPQPWTCPNDLGGLWRELERQP